MKSIIFALILGTPISGYARTITFIVPDNDIAIVENDVPDAVQWIKDMWTGKLASCKKRMIKQEIDRSVGNGETLPAGEIAIIAKAFARPDYLNRKQRDAAKATP